MQFFERTALIASAVVGLSVAGWMFLHGYKAPSCPPNVSLVPVVIPVATTPAPPTQDEPRTPVIAPEYTDTDVVADPPANCKADGLAEAMRGWIAGHNAFAIDMQRGVAVTHTRFDEGRDGPVPAYHAASARRVCGEDAMWLRRSMLEEMKWHAPLTCCDGTCTYAGMEYAPNGTLKFEKRHDKMLDDDVWVLVSWDEQYTVGVGEEWANESRAQLAKAIKKMPARCVGETAGVSLE